METTTAPTVDNDAEYWAPITKLAKTLHCSTFALHTWGRAGNFGYRQIGPRLFVVCVPEVLAFYTSKYPNIAIDLEEIDAVMQHTA